MKSIDPDKVFARFMAGVSLTYPLYGRKYTVTHSDETGDIYVFIGLKYAYKEVSKIRDEVLLEWREGIPEIILMGEVLIDGEGIYRNSKTRNAIFLREMPIALQAVRYADRALFQTHPELDETQVYIQFNSTDDRFQKVVEYGEIGKYKIDMT